MINRVQLIGRLGQDPELRYTPSGTAVANFSLATSERWKGADGQKQEKTEWHKITAWKEQAKFVGEYVKKGQLVYIEGRLETRNYENKEGHKVYVTEIIANKVQSLEFRDRTEGAAGSQGAAGSGSSQVRAEEPSFTEDDIPF